MADKFGKWGGKFWGDTAERVLTTFLQVLIPAWIAAGNIAHMDVVNALEISASAAGLSLLKCVLANMVTGATPSASVVGVSSWTSEVPPT